MRIFSSFQNQANKVDHSDTHRRTTNEKAKVKEAQDFAEDERIVRHAPPRLDRGDVLAKIERAKKKSEVQAKPVDNGFRSDMPETIKKPTVQASKGPSKEVSSEEQKVESKAEASAEAHLLQSDVQNNDPKNPKVREKLKDALNMNTFNFSDKERAVLSKILTS
ncbi:hypothetical protein HBN50_00595 [Halobacteriovorax sp. GB3]|uniref:hypothetical protein n=1 Tax=Halobacteriovorax sp. GB3 TaxID=2719615 RepID=UPI0023613E79|nr:hypothetical protein [Halobacteriovorax sp. GB3]MDD0851564.1 hypothetical protein [Halobacteriovorax sp. GB3]